MKSNDYSKCPYCSPLFPTIYPDDPKNQEAVHRRHLVFHEGGYPFTTASQYEALKTAGRERLRRAETLTQKASAALDVLAARYGHYIEDLILYGLTKRQPVWTFDQFVARRDVAEEFGIIIARELKRRLASGEIPALPSLKRLRSKSHIA